MTSRRRILYLAVSGERVGGAETQYEYLIRDLDRCRWEPILLTPARGELSEALAGDGVRTEALGYPAWRRRSLLSRRRACNGVVDFARRHGVALVHGDFNLGPYLLAVAEALGVPSVLHVRGRLEPRWMRRYGLARASAVIAIGDRYRDQLLDGGVSAGRIAVVQDGTDLERFTPKVAEVLRHEYPSLSGRVLLGLVGRIEPFKRQLDFLRAAERVLDTGREAGFFIVGAPNRDWRRYGRKVGSFPAARRIEAQVAFTGRRTDIERVIASLDVLVTLSGGSVMLEAMACGVPVLTATDRPPGLLEMVRDGETGLVVPAYDFEALVAAMQRLCDDPQLRRSLGAAGHRRATMKFGRDRLVRETERVYEALLGC